jgi:hypothetical protein
LTQSTQNNKPTNGIWDILTLIAVLATLVVATFQITIFINPQAIFNPFPPMEMPEVYVLPTATEGAATIPPVWTETSIPTKFPTPLPSEVPAATATIYIEIQDGTPVAEVTPPEPTATVFEGYYAFAIQNEQAINSTIFKPDDGCNWAGIAGQVFDLQGRPVKGIRVWLRGTINGEYIEPLGLTLESSPYGPSGFEFTIANKPVASSGKLSLQLFDQAMIPISEKVFIDTFDDCEHNLVLVNFKQVR